MKNKAREVPWKKLLNFSSILRVFVPRRGNQKGGETTSQDKKKFNLVSRGRQESPAQEKQQSRLRKHRRFVIESRR